ncbi:MAG: hypothetical protein EZS28_002558 [Streblomastix strix]|uniref:Uncharacterized protein n=1 Tax=Streblomastix strix TaxID=222440 RepID=A0A5J4X3W7_9EUKA|nr:MAG: hypothetical protein EZS28_002558 [Streblomastix strix]
MSEALRQASIHPQSFTLSRQEFFDQPVSQMISNGQRYTRAPLGARGNATCSMVQSCQINQQITIPGERLAQQLNLVPSKEELDWARTVEISAEVNQMLIGDDEHVKFWIDYLKACGPFQQIAICNDNTKLWETSICAREQAAIAANSLSDQCTMNSVSAPSLESIVRRRKYYRIFVDIPVEHFAAGSFNYLIPYPITIAIMDLRFLIRFEGCIVKQV